MQLDGMHHITMITGDAQRNVDFYADVLGLAAGKEDGQLRLARGLPPLLRRRAGLARLDPDLVRVRRCRTGPRRRGHDPHDPTRRRWCGVAGLLGAAARSERILERAVRGLRELAQVRRLRRPRARAGTRQPGHRTAEGRAPRDPGRACDHRRRGRPRLHRPAARGRRAAADRDARLHRHRRHRHLPPHRSDPHVRLGL